MSIKGLSKVLYPASKVGYTQVYDMVNNQVFHDTKRTLINKGLL
jgi:hypothetical protein